MVVVMMVVMMVAMIRGIVVVLVPMAAGVGIRVRVRVGVSLVGSTMSTWATTSVSTAASSSPSLPVAIPLTPITSVIPVGLLIPPILPTPGFHLAHLPLPPLLPLFPITAHLLYPPNPLPYGPQRIPRLLPPFLPLPFPLCLPPILLLLPLPSRHKVDTRIPRPPLTHHLSHSPFIPFLLLLLFPLPFRIPAPWAPRGREEVNVSVGTQDSAFQRWARPGVSNLCMTGSWFFGSVL